MMEDKSIIKIAEVTLTVSWEGDWDQPWTPADELWQYVGDRDYNLSDVSLLKTEVKMKQLVDKDE
tara:strand:+ start:278 stop:472 length:195 start_codon:yes stop_codon:yes gene_type:complete